MSTDKYLTYRGDLRAAVGVGGTLVFVATHPEGKPTGINRLDLESLNLDCDPLPGGGRVLIADGETIWVAGNNGRIYGSSARGGEPKDLEAQFADGLMALALLEGDRLAALTGREIRILGRQDGKLLQTLELSDPGTSLASDPTGRWLAAGTLRGEVAVFDSEEKPEFLLSESGRLHEGAVTALLFEPDELRFLSAGADQKLLSTLARGKLEPEDRGRGANHTDIITSITWGSGDRFLTGSRDGSIKSWPRVGAARPATTRDGVGKVIALAIVTVHDRPQLVAACDDNSLRIFPIDSAGKVGDLARKVFGFHAWAAHELEQDEARRREAALRDLADDGDAKSIDLIAQQVAQDADHGLRLTAARALGASSNARAATKLEPLLKHADEAVRIAAFEGLRRHLGATDFRPIDLALKTERADVGRLAVQALEGLAKTDDQALTRLLAALDSKVAEVRQSALIALEHVHDPKSPEADLIALGAKHADIRRLALARLRERAMLAAPQVRSAVRRRGEDDDAEVRRTAFLLSILAREPLAEALRAKDPELRRQLDELENVKEAKVPRKRGASPTLNEADIEPLLQATASRALDTCLRGGRGLALLGDPRAFGLLLQLSRDDDPAARVEVCRALAALDDPRALNRLRSLLDDSAPQVRDAAFSALLQIRQDDPLLGAESGLNASFEDIRGRGLQALVAAIRKSPPKSPDEPAEQLLARALNDGFANVRGEAFKAALNLQLAGGGPRTLRFALRSIHADVRREVFNEAMAQVGQPWVWDLLLEFFNDPDVSLRADAFAFASKKTKGLEFLEAGLNSRYADIRKQSVDALIKKRTAAAQTLLVKALDDEDRSVRLTALESLIGSDTLPALAGAITNPHPDVRLRAAKALARHGDPRALKPLLDLATAPEPTERERQGDWADLVESALDGLGELGDPAALPAIISMLDSPRDPHRKQAARALIWVARAETRASLLHALQHADPQVKYHSALGLAFAGDPTVAPLLFTDEAAKVISIGDRIAAAWALGPSGQDQLVAFLDSDKESARSRALSLLLFREWKDPDGHATRVLACLSSRLPRIRLTAARALEAIAASPDAFRAFVHAHVNDRGDKPPWKINEATVDTLAELLNHAGPLLRERTARLLRHLQADEQSSWDLAWKAFQTRFAPEIAALRDHAARRTPISLKSPREALRELAFGAYVGLLREQGSVGRKGQAAASPEIARVRQSALGRILALANADPEVARAARPILVQSLGDPNQNVRLQAFEHLQTLGMDPAALGAEAIESGFNDLGIKGLESLTAGASSSEGQAVLEQVLMTRKDDLALDAARLLIERRGVVAVAASALGAAHEAVRRRAVAWLAEASEKDPAARDLLHQALGSRYQQVREAAAFALAQRKDNAAFPALVQLLAAAPNPEQQKRVIAALVMLGDPRTPDGLLDRLEHDPAGNALADDLIRAAGNFRRSETVDRLMPLIDRDRKWRDAVFNAVLTIAGFDQKIEDREDENPDRSWEEKQHPRRVEILARLLDRGFTLGDVRLLGRLIPLARWARGQEVEPTLALLANHPEETLRRDAVEALAWRLRKRDGDPGPLKKALSHKDPTTQFLAAEGLAKAGRADGLNVLLASIDYLSDLNHRCRAVLALGELGDERALDPLLRLANEDGHALQDAAAEAIGHLGKSAKTDEIFKVLERHAKGSGSVAERALKGLRWLNTANGWDLIRQRASAEVLPGQFVQSAISLLGFHDDPATRDLLLQLLSGQGAVPWVTTREAMGAARRLWGPEALEPDYALLQSGMIFQGGHASTDESLGRVVERGDPERIFEILPRCHKDVRRGLTLGLLRRTPLPTAEARAALASSDAATVALAARILGRAEDRAQSGKVIQAALQDWRTRWEEQRRAALREGKIPDAKRTECVCDLIWASGRLGVGRVELIELASGQTLDATDRPIRLAALKALATGDLTPEAVAALESAAKGPDAEIRTLATEALARRAPDRALKLAETLVSDRVSFDRLARSEGERINPTMYAAAGNVHDQGIVLPHLVGRGAVAPLAAVANDRKASEASRLGAIDGLAALADPKAEEVLRSVGSAPDNDEDLRKEAWRALRRSKRLRRKAAGTRPGVVV